MPALHPRQAPHPDQVDIDVDVYSLVTIKMIRYALPDHVGVEVKLLSEGRVQTHQLSSLAVLSSRGRLYSATSRVFLTSGIPITPLRATLFFFTKAVTSSRELGGFGWNQL